MNTHEKGKLMDLIVNYWEYVLGTVFVFLMLWWVAGRDDRRKREYERELARKWEHEQHRQTLEEWVGWDGIHSNRGP